MNFGVASNLGRFRHSKEGNSIRILEYDSPMARRTLTPAYLKPGAVMTAVALLTLILASGSVFADVYTCHEGGRTVFRSQPCSGETSAIVPSQPQAAPETPVSQELAPAPRGNAMTGHVVGVSDGDTITLLVAERQRYRIRLIGADAPEKAQPYGQRSKQNLSALAFDQEAKVDCRAIDRWGRADCVVYVKGVDVALEQVRVGLAWWYRQYAKNQSRAERQAYEEAESVAKTGGIGLWADPSPIPPWDWRKGRR